MTAQCGFQVGKAPGLPPKRECLQGVFDPAWTVRRRQATPEAVTQPGHCAVIGAGLAGAAVAAKLALRGWQVTVLDAAAQSASGASALPVGVMAPHVSPDDALLSRLTRSGIRATWQQLEALLEEGSDWRGCGALERRPPGDARLPASWSAQGPNESWLADVGWLASLGLAPDTPAIWHARAGWVRPARLINAWLSQPGIHLRPDSPVARLARHGEQWRLMDGRGRMLLEADRVVVAAGLGSQPLAPALPLQPVRGQVAWGHVADAQALPNVPINGDGHLIAGVPDQGAFLWLTGASFDRDSDDATLREADMLANQQRLERLHAGAAALLAPAFAAGEVKAWAGVRCASGDRRPLVGPVDPQAPGHDGPWICAAMGSRGLSFAALCAELLAARWHGEPLPLPTTLAKALDTARL
jgi:tRNA 5-methylaminomethyl-2-thiouridine biosynthesis bifunctional protein